MQKERKKCTASLMSWSQKICINHKKKTKKTQQNPQRLGLKSTTSLIIFAQCNNKPRKNKYLIEIWQSKNNFSWKISSNKKASCQKKQTWLPPDAMKYPQIPRNLLGANSRTKAAGKKHWIKNERTDNKSMSHEWKSSCGRASLFYTKAIESSFIH